jgi:hypothetical protein
LKKQSKKCIFPGFLNLSFSSIQDLGSAVHACMMGRLDLDRRQPAAVARSASFFFILVVCRTEACPWWV